MQIVFYDYFRKTLFKKRLSLVSMLVADHLIMIVDLLATQVVLSICILAFIHNCTIRFFRLIGHPRRGGRIKEVLGKFRNS